MFQYRKRYGLHAMVNDLFGGNAIGMFQYRKRYGLHAMRKRSKSGQRKGVSIPQAVWIACNMKKFNFAEIEVRGFNTASGMDCMQFKQP